MFMMLVDSNQPLNLFLKEDEIETLSKEPILDCTHKEVSAYDQVFEKHLQGKWFLPKKKLQFKSHPT